MPSNMFSTTFLPVPTIIPRTNRRARALSPLRPLRMATPLPDDTALDMLSFALSGPGIFAGSIFALSGVALLLFVTEIGPRKTSPMSFFLRIELPGSRIVEMPDGTARRLRKGETVLRLRSREECTAVGKVLGEEVRYSMYEAVRNEMKLVGEFPKMVNAVGGEWSEGVVQKLDEGETQARWEEYAQLGEVGEVDLEWRAFVEKLGGVSIEVEGDCKLCGGKGWRRCYKCGGQGKAKIKGRTKGGFVCDCEEGKRSCEWCSGKNES